MKYRDCVFDLYGTLLDIRTDEYKDELWEKMTEMFGKKGAVYHPEELRDTYFSLIRQEESKTGARDSDDHEAHPEIQIEKIFSQLFAVKGVSAEKLSVDEYARQFRVYSREYIRAYDGAAELLEALKKKGKRIWLLSNAQRIFTMDELKETGLLPLFDGIYISSDYGCRKPDPTFFQTLLLEQGIQAEAAVMIGNDGSCDIQPAKALGMKTIYIRSNISPEEPIPEADYVLPHMDLYQLQSILLKQEVQV